MFAAAVGLFLLPGCALAAPSLQPPIVPAARVSGDVQFGQTFLLRDSFALTLKSAKYTVERVNIGDACYFPQADEKLLVLRFRVENPGKDMLTFDGNSIPFSVMDAAGVSHESVQDVGLEPAQETAEFELKPGEAQDDLYTVLVTSGTGSDTALVVETGREGIKEDAVRCLLFGKVQPLSAPFTSPLDRSGATALRRVSARRGIFYPMALLDARLDSAAYTSQPLGGSPPDAGQRYLTATFTIQNKSPGRLGISGVNFTPVLRDAQGQTWEYNQSIYQPATDVPADTLLAPDAKTDIRFFWSLPTATRPQTLSLTEGESRAYVFDVSGVK